PPVDSVVAAAKFVPSSQLKHQKNNFQHKLILNREESLKDPYAQKSRSYLYSFFAERSKYISRHGDFSPARLQSKHLTRQTKNLPAVSVASWKGVDRAYPLKPVSHHKGVSVPVVVTAEHGNFTYMEEAQKSRPSSVSNRQSPVGRSQLAAALCPRTAEPEQSASHLHRTDLPYVLKLEADGQNMEKEIRKKEALLIEKLRRTQESLRRIQREKELLVKAEERREREAGRTHERRAAKHSEEKTLQVAVGLCDGGVQSAEATIPKPGTTLHPQELAMRKLKKEQLVASNSKIQGHTPMECFASCSELALKCSPSPSALSDQDSGNQPSAEVLHMQAASAVEQVGLEQCSFCGRNFLCTRLEKHMSVCSKSKCSKRKVFDSRKARAKGTDLEQYQQQKSSESPQDKLPRKNHWRRKHEFLIQTVRQARQVQEVLSKGGKVSDLSMLPPIENPDYVACPCCKRRFAPQAAERHIPICKTIRNRPPPPPQKKR
ncbi:ZC21C protein, partial [Steatornis caripensis]|nr:ZC21C protein [Steatornis caripensis]